MTRCPLCNKKSAMANKRKLLRGHYNPVNRYRKYPNLQWAIINPTLLPAKLRINFSGNTTKRLRICASCIKTLGKNA